uniref:Uncharacterized protein n=1 Tax=Cacopsylla melanoneura TaxID=428564 RepID=A0A8D8W5M5_9HEMI
MCFWFNSSLQTKYLTLSPLTYSSMIVTHFKTFENTKKKKTNARKQHLLSHLLCIFREIYATDVNITCYNGTEVKYRQQATPHSQNFCNNMDSIHLDTHIMYTQ